MKATLEIVGYIGDVDTLIVIGALVINRQRWQRLLAYYHREVAHAETILRAMFEHRMAA